MTANLTVANKASGETFTVNVKGNVTIKNYKHNGKLQPGEVLTVVKDGEVRNYYCQKGDTINRAQRALNLSSHKYTIFEQLKALDGNPNDLTEKDLQKLKQDKSLQAKLNIFAVRHDPEAKVTGIYSSANDANPFMFDYE